MKRQLPSRRRALRSGSRTGYRPVLETLELRLPPGDVLWGLLLGDSPLVSNLDPDRLEASPSLLRKPEQPELIRETELTALAASETSRGAIVRESTTRPQNPAVDLHDSG
jgi:hypothetical protein